jgi:uncharacterized membrane protein AbrB (regulator of aidB expression)
MRQRSVPDLDMRAVIAGLALSVVVAVIGVFLGFSAIGALAGVAAGGFVAGRMVGRDGLYHGAIVGMLAIIVASIAASAGNANVTNVLADTLSIVVSDVLILSFSSAGGWLSTRSSRASSSADRDRGR